MKKVLFVLQALFFFSPVVSAQDAATIVQNDAAIKLFISHLPETWAVSTEGNTLILYRKEKVWVPRESLANIMDCETCKQQLQGKMINFDMDKRYCYLVTPRFVLLVTNQKSSDVDRLNYNAFRKAYNADTLEKKYNLHPFNGAVAAMNKSETKDREKYMEALAENAYFPFPAYMGSAASLYLLKKEALPADEKSDPMGVSTETRAIETMLENYLGTE